jgi:D-beta-D-heptose 7-phosphate kinase/D-beta-D-heptose 1-phosphate adenosyltransferase
MRLTIIGENCWDFFKYGKVSRLNPEAPTPILNPISVTKNVGMAANVVENLKSLGAETRLITNKEKIEKIRFVDSKSNYILLREDRGDKVSNSFNIDEVDWDWPDAIIVSDYNKGFLTLQNILQISKRHKLTFLDTKKPLNIDYMSGYSFIKINEGEWENSKEKGNSLHEWQHKLIVTLSENGAMFMGINFPPSDSQSVKDISGAGDTFLAALVYKYVETKDISQSITFANKCAGEVVKRKGVSVI